ncbi:Uncharacterised protein [Mycobacterium tuberculosis]|uniref:Uncharacterized protein n=1 Tax=Mycobacterium tuberculosis TaxID=1773 RepID=A0A916LFM6_MYCTX|nr:Uncharacterised protein [Mycobacterium tuberculosis]COZ59370.1 Uncharacterised protein [Mycobacterium tuberculosis]
MPSAASISTTVSQPSINGTSGILGCSRWASSTIKYAALSGCSMMNPAVLEW